MSISKSFQEIQETIRAGSSLEAQTKILYEENEKKMQEISAGFPQNLLLAFCPHLEAKEAESHGKCVVFAGSTADAYSDILNWMMKCNEAKEVVRFPRSPNFIFYRATRVAAAAALLGIDELEAAMEMRLGAIAAIQVHTDDVYMV
jgi:hypothetical protein